jgi:hypothetical protein
MRTIRYRAFLPPFKYFSPPRISSGTGKKEENANQKWLGPDSNRHCLHYSVGRKSLKESRYGPSTEPFYLALYPDFIVRFSVGLAKRVQQPYMARA